MRITDVKVTVWEWRDIPPTRYTLRVTSSGSRSTHMALVRIVTDEGIEGHAFLGSALGSLGHDAQLIIDRYKPYLVGKDPLDRERIWQTLSTWALGFNVMRMIRAIDVSLWDIAGKAAGVLMRLIADRFLVSRP